uniref:protein O-GlcNAcase n=1 Tax=Globodera rostochiensis TaxID=31243 RepID=A0A914H9V9_GLORO
MAEKGYICGVVEGFYGRPWTTEQRKHLFTLLRKFGMNTYLYAPKDDLKHRAEWRLLYTPEEAALLESLIKAAKDNGITFVYALSPGIDIVYSSAKELKAIRDKLTQVRSLGCTAFSLLFDDIEASMNEMDRKQFSSFALAQLTVSNSIFESLGCSPFFFCPTEYCESSASPSLEESNYLNLLGSKLHPDIHILWTGPRVVSRFLTVDHLQKVTNVLRRKPLIWDNLHANDYDPKRVFMGPFLGRSVAIKNVTSGLLLNPNCKYEANYVPFFTLAEWVQSGLDAPKVEEDSNVVLESSVSEEAMKVVERSRSTRLYHPITSLRRALDDWLPQFYRGPGPTIPPLSQRETQSIATVIGPSMMRSSSEVPPTQIRTCEGNEFLTDLPPPIYTSPIGSATTVTAHDASSSSTEPQTVNSLTVNYNEPMEIPILGGKDMSTTDRAKETDSMEFGEEQTTTNGRIGDGHKSPLVSLNGSDVGKINLESVALFVDIFYLPFDYGKRGAGPESNECEEWHRRFKEFSRTTNQLTELYKHVIHLPNKSLLQEIFPYLWEAQGLFSVLCALLKWMRKGNLLIAPTESSTWGLEDVDADSEPWALGGGFLPDMQKLVIASPKVGEMFTVKYAIPLSLTCYSIRPVDLLSLDKLVLFDLFALSGEKNLAKSVTCLAENASFRPEEFFFDLTFAPFLKYGAPSHHFAAECADEDANGEANSSDGALCSLALGILNASGLVESFNSEFIAKFRQKYLPPLVNEQQMEEDTHSTGDNTSLDAEMIVQSLVEIRWLMGSNGFFTIVGSDCGERIELLTRLGLQPLVHRDIDGLKDGFVVMGHAL